MRYLSLLTISLILISCGRYFPPDRNIKRGVSKSELIGVWELNADSLAHLVRDGYVVDPNVKYQIVFREDGTMSYDSTYSESYNIKNIKADGRYFISRNDDGVTKLGINLLFDGMENGHTISIAEEDGRLVLWTVYGDPDMWEFIEYTKK